MNTLILNRDTFQMPEDGWYQIAPLGEFPHQPTGVVQIVDQAACDAMTNAFKQESTKPNFAGLLIDFDHFSLDDKLKSEAAGWMSALEYRAPRDEGGNPEMNPGCKQLKPEVGAAVANSGAGLWAKIRWSDVGEECVKGGRYRFLSPVWSRQDCEDLGNGRLRPIRLLNAAVTNDPNLKGMVPLSNRAESREAKVEMGNSGTTDPTSPRLRRTSNTERFRWELGSSPDDRHCPSCEALAGQVHTRADWDAAGVAPEAGGLYCQGNCHCSLVKTDEAASGVLGDVPLRSLDDADGATANRSGDESVIANIGWTDEARDASLAVRRAKAAARRAAAERAAADEASGDGAAGPDSGDGDENDPYADDYLGWFDEEGLSDMTPEAIDALTEQIRQKLRDGETLEPAEEGFLIERGDGGYAGDSDSDPVFEWQERHAAEEAGREREASERSVEGVHARAEDLMERETDGEELSEGDRRFLERYRGVVGNRQATVMPNVGWSDEARRASLAVRKAKSAARAVGKRLEPPKSADRHAPGAPPVPWAPPVAPGSALDDGGMYWAGGSQYFDEATGQYIYPPPQPPVNLPGVPGMPPGQAHILPYPYPPQQGAPGEWPPQAGMPIRVYGPGMQAGNQWSLDGQIAADKARRRAAMEGKS